MRIKNVQGTFADTDEAYAAFVDKFKAKKTTDDCITPAPVYEAVADWVAHRYGVDRSAFVRPFWPGADYRDVDYPDGGVVVDNPPFSILSKIIRDYTDNGIDFFLFGPALTIFSGAAMDNPPNYVIAGATITYENGAKVPTSFVTSLGENLIEVRPDLHEAIEKASAVADAQIKGPPKPVYDYPYAVATAARLVWLAVHGTAFTVPRGEAAFIRAMDAQRAAGASAFGGAFILSERMTAERAAAERAAAERLNATVWQLSPRELEIQKRLGEGRP